MRSKNSDDATSKDVIVLGRHGKSALSRRITLNWREYRDWWASYDDHGLAENQAIPDGLQELAGAADTVMCSSLTRARETAQIAAGRPADIATSLLIEAPLPSPPLGPIKLHPTVWGTIARIFWYFGYSDGQESHYAARLRAGHAADLLEDKANDGKLVYVAAHGWFNRMIRAELRRRGWRCTENQGDLHWRFRRFERTTHK